MIGGGALVASYGAIALGIAFVVLGVVVTGLGYALQGLVAPEAAKRFELKPALNY
jgi:hypothetical protein